MQSRAVVIGLVVAIVSGAASQDKPLPPPMMLERDQLEAGNPLATYSAMVRLEKQYRGSPFAGIYDEVRCNFEEFLGSPFAGSGR